MLLRQLAAQEPEAVYLSADTLDPGEDLFGIVRRLCTRFRFTTVLVDKIHFLEDALGQVKKIVDFLDTRLIFTSSVAVAMKQSAHDLSRRVKVHDLDYFGFGEYLKFSAGLDLPTLCLGDLLEGRWTPGHLRCAHRFEDYVAGGLLPFSLEEPAPMPLLANTLEKVIEQDIPRTLRLTTPEIPLLHKTLDFVGKSGVDGINYTSVSANIGITKYKAEQYLGAFESAFIMQRLFPAGTNVLREPKVLLLPPLRLLYREMAEATGGLREDFFAFAMRRAGIDVRYLKGTRGEKTPDFLVEHDGQRIAFEVGGKGKGRSQFKNCRTDRKTILSPGAEPSPQRIPLHLAGFLAES